jgi:hypothetical protein
MSSASTWQSSSRGAIAMMFNYGVAANVSSPALLGRHHPRRFKRPAADGVAYVCAVKMHLPW